MKKQAVSNIRVLLKGTQKEYGRSRIAVQGTKLYYTVQDGRIEPHKAGSKIFVEPAQVKKRLVLYGEGGNEWKIDGGSYGYQGTMEITNRNQKLYLVNELPLQNYLYGVVPGEMSASSSLEALKAQAVCARSYSLQQMAGKRMAEYGAHVDDTVAFQVYGTQPRSAATDRAVNETKDQVLMYKGKLAADLFLFYFLWCVLYHEGSVECGQGCFISVRGNTGREENNYRSIGGEGLCSLFERRYGTGRQPFALVPVEDQNFRKRTYGYAV